MIRFRRLDNKDIIDIERLWNNLQDYHQSINPDLPYISFRLCREMFSRKIFTVFSAWSQKSIVGFCIPSYNNDGGGIIESLFVQGNFRHRKIGSTLFKKSLAWLRKQKVERIHIGVVYGNTKVFPFYEKFGFKPQAYILRN
ncbi:MAG: GNAT family N-acetyltransferase [Spirochaetales bacterium]|nr:GNAT family N-acetyltransferase [Spirochaetales bacterium]